MSLLVVSLPVLCVAVQLNSLFLSHSLFISCPIISWNKELWRNIGMCKQDFVPLYIHKRQMLLDFNVHISLLG